jgi:hypothetical protein
MTNSTKIGIKINSYALLDGYELRLTVFASYLLFKDGKFVQGIFADLNSDVFYEWLKTLNAIDENQYFYKKRLILSLN